MPTTDDLPHQVRAAFRRSQPEPRTIPPGTRIFRCTGSPELGFDLKVHGGEECFGPWWGYAQSPEASDTGLMRTLATLVPILAGTDVGTSSLHGPAQEFIRARLAVSKHWNDMTHLHVVRLRRPKEAFYGQAAGQRIDDVEGNANVYFIGGAYQLFVPGLGMADLTRSE